MANVDIWMCFLLFLFIELIMTKGNSKCKYIEEINVCMKLKLLLTKKNWKELF